MRHGRMAIWILAAVSTAMVAEVVLSGELSIGAKLPLADREMKNVDGQT